MVTAELRAEGFTYDEIRRNRDLRHLRRGAWIARDSPEDRSARYLQLISGTYGNLPLRGVLSYASAAAMHGLPLPYGEMSHVHVTRAPGARHFSARYVRVHVGTLPLSEITTVQGLPVTTLSRTLADIARTWDEPWAVAATDAALNRSVTRADLSAALDSRPNLPGVPQARRVIAFANALSGSPGESISRCLMRDAGLPVPHLQTAYRWEGGVDVTDFDWGAGVIGEFDGYGKYLRETPNGTVDPARAVYLEKLREDRLRRRCTSFHRWGWAELLDPQTFIAPLAESLGVPYRPIGVLSKV